MKSFQAATVLAVVTLFTAVFAGQQTQKSEIADQVLELEKRVSNLERIVFSTSQLSENEALRRLENAKRTFDHSQKLRQKGFINEAQLKNDRFALEQAKQELELARSSGDRAMKGAELELLNAEQELAVAERDLEYTKKLASRGFSTQFEVQRCERQVRNRERDVEFAKQKLDAFRQLKEKDASDESESEFNKAP